MIIIIRDESTRKFALKEIKALPLMDMHPIELVIREYKPMRRLEQLALYWVRLDEISSQAWIEGNQYKPAVLHAYAKEAFLPDRTSKGKEKFVILPNGERRLSLGTGELNTKEFAEYLVQVEAWAASLGVMMTDARHLLNKKLAM